MFGVQWRRIWIMWNRQVITTLCLIQWIHILAQPSASTRTRRYLQAGLVQLSHTCIVYDETPANRVPQDDGTGNACMLFSATSQFHGTPSDQPVVQTKIITTANPVATYFTIHPLNHTLLTTKRVDREQMCAQWTEAGQTGSHGMVANSAMGSSEALQTCCTQRRRDCELQLTVLIQTTRPSYGHLNTVGNQTIERVEKQSKFLSLNIRLVDINDNAPRFESPVHQMFVPEGMKVGTRLQLPLAHDADSDDYGIVRYYLHTQNDDTFELVHVAPVHNPTTIDGNVHHMSPFVASGSDRYASGSSAVPLASAASLGSSSLAGSVGASVYYPESSYNINPAPSQLYLKLIRPLDWERKKVYKFVLVAEDNGAPALTGQLEIQVLVTDENDNHPVFRNKTLTISVPENTIEGKRLLQVFAHDPDEGTAGKVIYSLNDGTQPSYTNPFKTHSTNYDHLQHGVANRNRTTSTSSSSTPQLFRIDPHSGWIILAGQLDYERAKHHVIRVRAHDEAGHPGFDEATVNVLVTDVNDVAPSISVEPVIEMNDRLRSTPRRQQSNRLNSLDLYVNEVPGLSVSESVGNSIQAQSQSLNPLLAFVVVRDPDTGSGGQFECGIQSARSGSVMLDGGNTYGDRSMSNGLVVSSSNIPGQAMSSTSVRGRFQFNPISRSQFELTSLVGFDHEEKKLENVVIVCADFGEPRLSSSFTVNLYVEDLNDNTPKFAQPIYQLPIEENRPMDSIVHRLSATDRDSGKNAEIEYTLEPSGMEFFRIHPDDGTLYTKMSFDREIRQSYRFQVFARDRGMPHPLTGSTNVEVTILDMNDNAPEFVGLNSDNCYKFRIAENEPVNTHVGILLGTDLDTQENAKLQFRLITSTSSFSLDPSSGELIATQSLDREKQSEYELTVMLVDRGRPPKSATAKVFVYVSDVNDHDPIVVFPANGRGNVTVSYREPPGDVVARIEARDPDEGHNALLQYSLLTGNRNSVFRLGSTSAELIIDRELDETDMDTYVLQILIQDAGVPPRSAQVQLMVKVNDAPARMYPHRFSNLPRAFGGSDREGSQGGTPSAIQYRRTEGSSSTRLDNRDSRQSETKAENGLVSAGAILVAIVALSCAIIVVLLGITVYFCGRRGLTSRRACNTYGRNRQNNYPSGMDMYKTGTMSAKSNDFDPSGSTPLHCTESILVDPTSGTVSRCAFGTMQSNPNGANGSDYTEQKLLRATSPIIYDGYTTCVPMNERMAHGGNYEAFTTSRYLIPLKNSPMQINPDNSDRTNHEMRISSRMGPKECVYPVALIGTGGQQTTASCTSSVSQPVKESDVRGLQRHSDTNKFTQSLRIRKSDWRHLCDSPLSEGSIATNNGDQQDVGGVSRKRLQYLRAARSWESLDVKLNASTKEVFLTKCQQPRRMSRTHRASPKPSNQNGRRSSELPLKVTWNPMVNRFNKLLQPELNVSTFKPSPKQPTKPLNVYTCNQHNLTAEPSPTLTRPQRQVDVEVNDRTNDPNTYTCLLSDANRLTPANYPQPDQSDNGAQNSLHYPQERFNESITAGGSSGLPLDNLIDLFGSGHTSSCCSQACDCTAPLPDSLNYQPSRSGTLDHAEFV